MTLERRYPEILKKLIAVVKGSSSLYVQDVGFQRTMDSNFKAQSQKASAELLVLINQILEKSGARRLELETIADVNKNWSAVQTAIDSFVDRTNAAKSGTGLKGPRAAASGSSSPINSNSRVVFYDKNISKPQIKFNPPVDNSYGPFKPFIVDKPFGIKPLNESLKECPADDKHEGPWYSQPYETEINESKYPKFLFEPSKKLKKPNKAKIKERPLKFVDDRKSFKKMLKTLCESNQIAVDLEHHDYRTYLGLTCLMQISTPCTDFLVDTLQLRSDLQDLNQVFCNPDILKVLHGARLDVLWLQRDLGLYIVNLFDTYCASRALSHARHSLAYLMEQYCQFKADKKFQLADWRQRPLTTQMRNYARADTHFLLYIAQEMRNKLIESNKLNGVLQESRAVARRRYEKPEYNVDEPGWTSIALKFRLNINDNVLEALYRWRDGKARDLDESHRYIMSNQVIAALTNSRPTTAEGVISACTSSATHLQRDSAQEIADLITAAIALPPRPVEFVTRRGRAGYNSGELFNSAEIDRAKAARLENGTIFQTRTATTFTPPQVNLEIVSHLGSDLGSVVNEESMEQASEASEFESSEAESSEPEVEEAPHSNKRRINVVETLDDFEAKPKKTKARKTQEPVEAFDFASAKPVMKRPESDRPNNRRKGPGGPRGAKQRTAKNAAKSVTYKRK